MRKAMKLILLILMVMVASCVSKQDANNHRDSFTIGKYLYEDDNGIIHIDESCLNLRRGNDDDGHKIYGKHMIDTAQFLIAEPQYFRVCSRCVNDEVYNRLLKMSERNNNLNTYSY